MKNIVFAMKVEGIDAAQIKTFENSIKDYLRSTHPSFEINQIFSCDYKEGLYNVCKTVKPDILVVSELLPGNGDFAQIIRDIKTTLPHLEIIVLLSQERPVGDALLATLVTLGIYNWLVAPWKPALITEMMVSPRKLSDVEIYMPKIIANNKGLAFETVIIEKDKEDKNEIKDINSNIIGDHSNKSIDAGSIVDLAMDENKSKNKVPTYRSLLKATQHGMNDKVTTSHRATFSEKAVNFKAIPAEKKDILFNNNNIENKSDLKEDVKSIDGPNQDKDVTIKDVKPKIERPQISKPVLDKKEKADINVKNDNKTNKQEKLLESLGDFKAPDVQKEDKKIEKVNNDDKNLFDFDKNIHKILCLNILPLESSIAYNLSLLIQKSLKNVCLIDLIKGESYLDNYDDKELSLKKSTYKDFNNLINEIDSEYMVVNAVAGNGLENIIDKFDKVIVIAPQDEYAIKIFVNRYGQLLPQGCILFIEKYFSKGLGIKELKQFNVFSDVATLKMENNIDDNAFSIQEYHEAIKNKKQLIDNDKYMKNLKFLLKSFKSR